MATDLARETDLSALLQDLPQSEGLRQGLRESPAMPLDDTVAVLEAMDAIRRQWSSRA